MVNNLWTAGAFDIKDNILWFVPHTLDLLCGYDIQLDKIIKMVKVIGISNGKVRCINTKVFDKYVIMISSTGDKVYVYDLEKEDTQYYAFGEMIGKSIGGYFECGIYQNKVYIFSGGNYNSIIVLDVSKKEIYSIECVDTKKSGFIDSVQYQSKIYLVNGTNKIFCFDMQSQQYHEYMINDESVKCVTIMHDENRYLYLSDQKGNLYKFDLELKKNELIEEVNLGYDVMESVQYAGSGIFFYRENGNEFLKVNLSDYTVNSISEPINKEVINSKIKYNYSKAVCYEDKIYIMNNRERKLYIVDPIDEVCNSKIILPSVSSKESKKVYLEYKCFNQGYIDERELLFSDYLDCI